MAIRITLRVIAFVLIFVLCLGTLQYFCFETDIAFLKLKQFAVRTGWYLPAFYAHIWGSSVILLCGFFQFTRRVYEDKRLHRLLGKIYVFGVIFFAAPGAYIMTFFIHRGRGAFISFLLQNSLWITFTVLAWIAIKKGRLDEHIRMMHRSYAMAFAAITLRFYIGLFNVFGHGVNFPHNYSIIAFLSWVPNLLLVEMINYNQRIYKFFNRGKHSA